MRWWAFWRRVQYGIGFLVVCALIGTGLYYKFGYEEPTCFDTLQNGTERGVDCGGTCSRVCAFDILEPKVQWAESFKIIDGQYNAVAYIENRNESVGSPEVGYTFRLYDDNGIITEVEGTTVLPPKSVYPVFKGRIKTGNRVPTRTTIELHEGTVWLPGEVGREQFELKKRELTNADSKPNLTAQIYNTALEEAQNVEVVATIFNRAGKPLTAAATIVENFGGKQTEDVVFTWPEPIAKTLRSCEIPTDVVLAIDLSGSMNNDSATPPEPITSVLAAAQSFVSRLGVEDQVGVVTYATNAIVAEELTTESARIEKEIGSLSIDPKEERGTTNTGDALTRIKEELISVRHNANARKVAILLTDGLATAPGEDPEAHAKTEADALKATGVELFTIGLGASADEEFLKSLASSAGQYFKAPTTRDLQKIYTAITQSICEEGASVIEIIPKTGTNFASWE